MQLSRQNFEQHSIHQLCLNTELFFKMLHFTLCFSLHCFQQVYQEIRKSGGAVASWLVRSTPDRVVRVRGLAGDIVLCSWARHFTLTVPLSTQVYKWVPA